MLGKIDFLEKVYKVDGMWYNTFRVNYGRSAADILQEIRTWCLSKNRHYLKMHERLGRKEDSNGYNKGY